MPCTCFQSRPAWMMGHVSFWRLHKMNSPQSGILRRRPVDFIAVMRTVLSQSRYPS